jgi:hypothetical protein
MLNPRRLVVTVANTSNPSKTFTELHLFSPLMNFDSELSKVRLPDGVTICQPNSDEKHVIEQDTVLAGFMHNWKFVVRCSGPLQNLALQSAPYTCCTALRLLKQGTVGLGPVYMMISPPLTFVSKTGRNRDQIYLDTYGPYSLARSEERRLADLYSVVKALDGPQFRRLRVAVLRLDFSYDSALAYSPIDLMTALEALYLDNETELTYKLAIRASYLLGDKPERRNDIFSTLKAAYHVRSKLVHGRKIPPNVPIAPSVALSSLELTQRTRAILRESILAFLNLLKFTTHKELVETLLDKNVLAGGNLLKSANGQ